jgi:hypothetical protein
MIDEQVCKALASIGDRVVVEVWRTGCNFTQVAYAVVVTVGLRWIRDGGAIVGGVGSTIAVGVDGCDRYGVNVPRRDTRACSKVSGRVALTVVVVSPASNDSIGSECDGVESPRRDA